MLKCEKKNNVFTLFLCIVLNCFWEKYTDNETVSNSTPFAHRYTNRHTKVHIKKDVIVALLIRMPCSQRYKCCRANATFCLSFEQNLSSVCILHGVLLFLVYYIKLCLTAKQKSVCLQYCSIKPQYLILAISGTLFCISP